MTEVLRKKQRKAVGAWLREVADLIGLRDTMIKVSHGPAPDDAWASCTPTYAQPEAIIKVHPEALEETPDDLARILVHELLHIHHGDLKLDLDEALEGCDPVQARWVMQVVVSNVEVLVDSLARVIVARVDLPSTDEIRKV